MNQNSIDRESEISLIDIVSFLGASWKKLAIAALVGAVLGFGVWWFLGSYSAEYLLLNNASSNSNSGLASNPNSATQPNSYALDLVSWKTIQKSLPNLAAQIDAEGKAPEGQSNLYRELANDQWWQKNAIPSYAISKADTKDLAGISKDLDAASTTILSLTLTCGGSTKEKSLENVRTAANFLRSGGAYLQIRNILNSYESEAISSVADIQKRITTTEIEMEYQVQRAKSLEDLHKRFPGNASVGGQVVDPKDSGAKYLPISTQIIAANNDINHSKEILRRLRDRLAQIALMKTFVEQASPLVEKSFDGLTLDAQLLQLEASLRAMLSKDDIQQIEILDQLRSQLLLVQARFTKGLEANTAPSATKKGMIKAVMGGFTTTFFLMLMMLLAQRIWSNIKVGVNK